jgi:hypothetical protein
VQLAFDAADRLVELVEERRGPVAPEEAARYLFALRQAPAGLARSLLEEVVAGDARLAWRGAGVGLAREPGEELPLDAARFVVVDLETTGLRPGQSRICEIGAVRLEGLTPTGTFQTLVDPGTRLPPIVSSLTGIVDADLAGAPRPAAAVQRFLEFSGDAVLASMSASSTGRSSSSPDGGSPSQSSTRSVSPAACSQAGSRARVSPRFRTSSGRPCIRAIAPCRTPRRRPRSSSP